MSLSEMEMEALIKYGESLTQFDNNEEVCECLPTFVCQANM